MDDKKQLINIDTHQLIRSISEPYFNQVLTQVNDHVVRISIMSEPYFWHLHPNSDETFLVLEGGVLIEMEHQSVLLGPGQLYTIPAGIPHKTSPAGSRSVNLTIEHLHLETIRFQHDTDPPQLA